MATVVFIKEIKSLTWNPLGAIGYITITLSGGKRINFNALWGLVWKQQ